MKLSDLSSTLLVIFARAIVEACRPSPRHPISVDPVLSLLYSFSPRLVTRNAHWSTAGKADRPSYRPLTSVRIAQQTRPRKLLHDSIYEGLCFDTSGCGLSLFFYQQASRLVRLDDIRTVSVRSRVVGMRSWGGTACGMAGWARHEQDTMVMWDARQESR